MIRELSNGLPTEGMQTGNPGQDHCASLGIRINFIVRNKFSEI